MEMKGFYFSLDALTASTVLIALTGFLLTINTATGNPKNNQEINELYTSAKQPYAKWNNSKLNQRNILTEIYTRYYSGNKSEAELLCDKYFNTPKYNLYFKNQTKTVKACGNIKISQDQNLITTQAPVTDIKINKTFIGPKKAIMVAKN